MSKEKLEKDFRDFNAQIEKMAKDELKNIKAKADVINAEVGRVGEVVDFSIKKKSAK